MSCQTKNMRCPINKSVIFRVCMPPKPAHFNAQRGCLADASGRRLHGITSVNKCSSYRDDGRGLRRGQAVDTQITAWINAKTPVVHAYAKRIVDAFADYGIEPAQAQVMVRNKPGARTRSATPIDIVGSRHGVSPYIIELKTSGCSTSGLLNIYDNVDPVYKTFQSLHWGGPRANTMSNRYTDQLYNGMNMYGHSNKLKDGTVLRGCLLIACSDDVHLFEHTLTYTKATGINAPKPPMSVKPPRKKKKCADGSQPKKRRASRPRPT